MFSIQLHQIFKITFRLTDRLQKLLLEKFNRIAKIRLKLVDIVLKIFKIIITFDMTLIIYRKNSYQKVIIFRYNFDIFKSIDFVA